MSAEINKVGSQTSLLGAAGEHFVMSEMLRRGFIAALAPVGVPNADIIVTDVEGGRLCALQIKSRRAKGSDGGWAMKAKHEDIRGARLFYCFVDFGEGPDDRPKIYVLPSEIVADAVKLSHAKWLGTPGRNGHVRKDSNLRRLLPDYSNVFSTGHNPYPAGWLTPYLSAWHLLQLAPANVGDDMMTPDE